MFGSFRVRNEESSDPFENLDPNLPPGTTSEDIGANDEPADEGLDNEPKSFDDGYNGYDEQWW